MPGPAASPTKHDNPTRPEDEAVPRSVMGNTDSHDEAIRAFNNADRGSDPTETSIALAIAQGS